MSEFLPLFAKNENVHLDPGEFVVVCPVCGDEHCHLGRVSVRQGQRETIVSGQKTLEVQSDGPAVHRGSGVRVDMWCEDGHTFRFYMAFHKGTIFANVDRGKDFTEPPPASLWRD